jgi:hypothetical protein
MGCFNGRKIKQEHLLTILITLLFHQYKALTWPWYGTLFYIPVIDGEIDFVYQSGNMYHSS